MGITPNLPGTFRLRRDEGYYSQSPSQPQAGASSSLHYLLDLLPGGHLVQSLAASEPSVKCLFCQVASEDLTVPCPGAAAGWSAGEGTALCGSWGERQLASLLQLQGCLLLTTVGFYGRPGAQPRGCLMGHCVLGATPQMGPGLEISQSLCGLQWCVVGTPCCL